MTFSLLLFNSLRTGSRWARAREPPLSPSRSLCSPNSSVSRSPKFFYVLAGSLFAGYYLINRLHVAVGLCSARSRLSVDQYMANISADSRSSVGRMLVLYLLGVGRYVSWELGKMLYVCRHIDRYSIDNRPILYRHSTSCRALPTYWLSVGLYICHSVVRRHYLQ